MLCYCIWEVQNEMLQRLFPHATDALIGLSARLPLIRSIDIPNREGTPQYSLPLQDYLVVYIWLVTLQGLLVGWLGYLDVVVVWLNRYNQPTCWLHVGYWTPCSQLWEWQRI